MTKKIWLTLCHTYDYRSELGSCIKMATWHICMQKTTASVQFMYT